MSEYLALREGLEFVASCNVNVNLAESDAVNVTEVVNERLSLGVDGDRRYIYTHTQFVNI